LTIPSPRGTVDGWSDHRRSHVRTWAGAPSRGRRCRSRSCRACWT
jgi:hypothetical protein